MNVRPVVFWYDSSKRKLILLDTFHQRRAEISSSKRLTEFLQTYNLTLEQCKRVHEVDLDQLGFFEKWRILLLMDKV
ncbi:hypothetical protein SAMN05444955_112117 [Lihuaxuella thermophila]|uniref:Uncharacterized protein n=1 Tax=Lihuaxuella thermophila TaxID=1173111 RepID=A0A1H8GXW6_9BACL|nr:hypothetical protein SAMN05444955_112117 [Lihuaxuella thermophila]